MTSGWQFPDSRHKRCARCSGLYVPGRGDNGFCSDNCYVLSRSSSSREPQSEALSRSVGNYRERRLNRAIVDIRLSAARTDNAIKAYKRSRGEALGLIGRLKGDPALAGYAIRGSAAERGLMRSAAELPAVCTGPDCPVCTAYRASDPAPDYCQHGFWPTSCSDCRAEANRARWGNGEISR